MISESPRVLGLKHQGVNVIIFEPCIILKPHMIEMGDGCRIDGLTKLEGGEGLILGRYVHVASLTHLNAGGGLVEIGDGVTICTGAKVLGGNHTTASVYMSSAAPSYYQVVRRRHTRIGNQAFIAANAVVAPGVTVGEGAVLSAGAVAWCDIPAWEVWSGNPATKLRDRERTYPQGCWSGPTE